MSTVLEEKKIKYKDNIDKISKESFNGEQKTIAKQIIDAASEENIDAIYQFISQRVKTGFVFDAAPEVNHNCVALLNQRDDLDITSNELFQNSHRLIIGENYDVLKNLLVMYTDQETGKGLIDFIYIDPPYNTEKAKNEGNDHKDIVEGSKFIYRDKFTRDGFLNLLNERLKLAKSILSDDGVIFCSINDSEQAYLKVLMDEIFGEENFIACMIWKCRNSLYYTEPLISIQTEYILAYAKKKDRFWLTSFDKDDIDGDDTKKMEGFYFNRIKKKYDDDGYSNPDNDPRGPFKTSGKVRNDGRPVYTVVSPTGVKHTEAWVYSPEVFKKLDADGQIFWGVDGSAQPRKKSYYKDFIGNVSSNLLMDEFTRILDDKGNTLKKEKYFEIGTTESGTKELKSIIGENPFDYPKPVALIKYLISLYPKKDVTVLDFFAGSGTTGQAVMELNLEDGGNRQFILVTNNENNIAFDVTLKRLKGVITGMISDTDSTEWKYSTKTPYLSGNSVKVFDIAYHELSLNDFSKAKELIPVAESVFKTFNENYSPRNKFDIYNELAALNPLIKE
ncbi:MAG: site-specific DNA-methyltransferase [Bacilli bacterium]|nr:site-specific DNA-methyltransferase [Bacilli bacterium]